MKVRDRIAALQRRGPRVSEYGQLYKRASELRAKNRRVDLYTLFVSDEQTHLLRKHVFESKKKARTGAEWSAWFARHLSDITSASVLPGLFNRTSKHWSVKRILGWTGNVKHAATNTELSKGWHRGKKARRKRR